MNKSNPMKKIICVALVMISISAKAGSCNVNGTGNWETPGNWTCGHVPGAGDNVTIGAGFTVTVLTNNGANIGNLDVFGTLQFTNGSKINLTSTSVVNVYTGGDITGGNGGAKLVFPSSSYSGPFSTSGPFYFANGSSGSGLLPLTLVSFDGADQNQAVTLSWRTENEENINSFDIESSVNGNSDWQILETIPPMAATGSGYSYTFIDHTNSSGDRYYRLKIVDNDGKVAYSKIVFIASGQTEPHSLALRQTSSSMNVVLPTSGSAQVSIFNISGQLVKTLMSGSEIFNIDVSSLSRGVYFLKACQGKNLYATKFLKQ